MDSSTQRHISNVTLPILVAEEVQLVPCSSPAPPLKKKKKGGGGGDGQEEEERGGEEEGKTKEKGGRRSRRRSRLGHPKNFHRVEAEDGYWGWGGRGRESSQ